MTIRAGASLLAALLAALASGCSSGHSSSAADKAGGSGAPTMLRLAGVDAVDQPDTPTIKYFAAQVAKLSGGALRVHVVFYAAGDKVPSVEVRTVLLVRAGKFDLGWIGARAWDELGVRSFQALQAPFLITSYALLDRVATSPLAGEMLAGLQGQSVVGLALVPDLLRHPIGFKRPLASRADFEGTRIRDIPSRATDALLRALGATPVHVSNAAVGKGALRRIDGGEFWLGNAGGSIVTANVTFFGKMLTLFAGRHAYDRLTDQQRQVLHEAAERTLRHVAANPPSESALARPFCNDNGRIVLASTHQLAELEHAAQPVYAQLERDEQTKSYIAQIRGLKATTRPDPPFVVPAGCGRPQQTPPGATGKLRSPRILNGTYHLLRTKAEALAFGNPANTPENMKGLPSVETRILNDGKSRWNGGLQGTYTIRGDRITFVMGSGPAESFAFSLDHRGSLRLAPVLPMDRGDQWVTAGVPWRRVGPPRKIP